MYRLSYGPTTLGEFPTLPEAFRAAKAYRRKNPKDKRLLMVTVLFGERISGWFLA